MPARLEVIEGGLLVNLNPKIKLEPVDLRYFGIYIISAITPLKFQWRRRYPFLGLVRGDVLALKTVEAAGHHDRMDAQLVAQGILTGNLQAACQFDVQLETLVVGMRRFHGYSSTLRPALTIEASDRYRSKMFERVFKSSDFEHEYQTLLV